MSHTDAQYSFEEIAPEGIVLQTWNLVSRIDQQNLDQVKGHGWSAIIPRMVTHHSKSTRRKSTTDLKFGTKT